MAVQLKFINRSHDQGNSEVVLFQKNVATDMEELAVAWKVIRHCGHDCYHPFAFCETFEVSVADGDGNHSPRVAVGDGQKLAVTPTLTGRRLVLQGQASSPTEVEVANDLIQGAVDVNIFRSGVLLARKTSVAPQQKAVFRFKPTLWIGAVSQVVQGEPLRSAVMSQVNTELSLMGVASADVVMVGGGGGPQAAPFAFSLENVVKA